MRTLRKLNPEESISKRRLIFDEDWLDKFNRLTVYIVFFPFIFLPIVMLLNEKFVGPNDEFILHWVLPASFILGVYTWYRNATEKRLIKVDAQFDSQTIRKLLLEYAKKNQYEIYRKSNGYIILNDTYSYWSSKYKKTGIFFSQDNLLLFTVIRDGFRLNLPTLFTHLFLKRDLIIMMQKTNTYN
jgi:hypothetical protein